MKNINWLLVVIVLLAVVLRFWQLGSIPAGFDADEAAYGYNAYSLLLTGKDEYGKSFPLALKSFGEYKPALYSYISIPFIILFDLTPLATRFATALFGVFSVGALFYLLRKLFGNEYIGITGSFLLAISPWHIMLSRTTSEVVVSLFFLILLVYGLFVLLDGWSKKWFALVFLSGMLAILSYTASTFFVMLLVGLVFVFTLKWSGRFFKGNISILAVLLVLVCTGALFTTLSSAERFKQVNIFQHPQTKLFLEEQIREDQFASPLTTRFFHNKVVNFTRTVIDNYAEYFTVDYLFLEGGYPFRQRIPSVGLFYIWQLPFLLIGIYTVIRKKEKNGIFLLLWWAVLLIPAALTFDEIPNVYRSLVINIPILSLMALGIVEATSLIHTYKKTIISAMFTGGVVVLMFWEGTYFFHQYMIHQQVHQPWYRGYAYKELILELEKHESNYKKIIITKANMSPYIYFLFYKKYDPALYQSQGSPRDLDYTGFANYIFYPETCPLSFDEKGKAHGEVGTLYVNKGDCPLPDTGVQVLSTVQWQDNTTAFQLISIPASKSGVLVVQ